MPSVMRKQSDEAATHETISCVLGEVSNSTAERLLVASENGFVSGNIAARAETASLGVEASSGLWPTEASGTADSVPCRAAKSCVNTTNGLDWKPDHTVDDIEMAERNSTFSNSYNEHSRNTPEYNSIDGGQFHYDTGDRDYRPRSNFPRSLYLPRGEPNGCGDPVNGQCSQRPAGYDSTAIDMSGIDEPPGSDEHITEPQHPKEAVPVITGAGEASTSQDDPSTHDTGMSRRAPKAKHQRKLATHLPLLVSADGKPIPDFLQLHPIKQSKSGIELLANAAESRPKGKQQESEKARLERKLQDRAAKRKKELPKAQSIPGYVGDKGVDFCLSYVTGCKLDLSGESVDKANEGGRLKNKKKKKANANAASSPEEWSSTENHPSASAAPCGSNGHRPATGGTADARASALAANARSTKEGTMAGSSRPAPTASQFRIATAPNDDAFQVVDRKKKIKNPVSSTGCQPVRLPLRGLPARDVLSSTFSFGSVTSIAASTCTDDDRSEGDGDSSPSSCTHQPLGSSEMDAGGGSTFLGSLLVLQQQQSTTARGPSVPAKAEPPKATWAAVAAARKRVCDSPAAVACHAASADDLSSSLQEMVAGDDARSNEPGNGSPPQGCAAAVEEATVTSREATGYQPPAAGLPETVIQSSSIVSWPNVVVNPGILADSSQMKSTPPERGADSYCERVRPVGAEAARVAEVGALTSSTKLASAAAASPRNTPVSGRKTGASNTLPEVPLQRCKGVEFVGSQWREFFLRDSSRRIAFGFHDPLSSAGGNAATESGDTGGLFQLSSNGSATGRPSGDSQTLEGDDLARTACVKASLPVAVPAEEDAASVAVCVPASLCISVTLRYDLPADAEPLRSPAAITFGVAASSTNVNTSECSSKYSAVHWANVARLTAGWLEAQELLAKDASRVRVYGGSIKQETDNLRRV